jgi:hypothetical protein
MHWWLTVQLLRLKVSFAVALFTLVLTVRLLWSVRQTSGRLKSRFIQTGKRG